MKGFITKTVTGLCLSITLSALGGCNHYRDIVDPCWPERYNSLARQSVRDLSNAQAEKGHILDQTIWNWHFEADAKGGQGATLNGAGIETLKLISRRLPAPDFQIYLQTAQDLPYTAGVAPEKYVADRNKLNERRIQAIQNFLAAQAPKSGAGAYTVGVHDFVAPGIPANVTDAAQANFLKGVTSGTMQNFTTPKIN